MEVSPWPFVPGPGPIDTVVPDHRPGRTSQSESTPRCRGVARLRGYRPPGIDVNEDVSLGSEPSGAPAEDPEPPRTDPVPPVRAHPPVVRLALVFYGLLWLAALVWAALDGRSLVWLPPAGAGSVWRSLGAGALAAASVVLVSHQL